MAIIKKLPVKLRKPVAKELMEYGIHNEVRRFVGKGKRVVPRFIPFVNKQGLDITDALKAQGLNPDTYSGTINEQFDLPASVPVPSGDVKKFQLHTPKDSLFFMHSVRFTASLTTQQTYPAGGNPLKALGFSYNKWTGGSDNGGKILNPVTYGGTSGAPSPTLTLTAVDATVIKEGMLITIPVYAPDTVDLLNNAPIGVAQGEISNITATTFDLINILNKAGETISITWSGAGPIFWPALMDVNGSQLPYYHFLKVALIANSPKKMNLYGGLANVPSLADNRQSHVHVERVYVSTLQGANDGYNQVERKHLFPRDGTINIEVENTFSSTLNVNGYVFGYQIFERGA